VQFGAGDLPPVSSPGGTTNITATLTDDLGNMSPATQRAVTIEQPFNPPTILPVEGNDIVNQAEALDGVQVSGTVQAGAAVTVSLGGFSTPAVVSGTTWIATVPAPVDGQATVTASIAGAGGGATSTRLFTVDKTPPGPPLVALVEIDDAISPAERSNGVPISGQAEVGSTVSVAINGVLIKTAVTDALGGWSVNYTAVEFPAAPGIVTMSASAMDAAGNQGIATVRPLTIQGLLVEPPLIEPPPIVPPPPVIAPPGPGLPIFNPPGILLEPQAARVGALLDQDVHSSGRLA
jgi:hypothetical protein